jgi:hypothetical protein
MFNIQALSQTLSAMPLDRLQGYLRQHQDDPYVVALGLSIAKQKKEAMAAQQGMAGQQPMPKVAQQEIDQIAPRAMPMPEDVGIGQLPAQNLAHMAGGGIVAFDDGGDVQDSTYGQQMGNLWNFLTDIPKHIVSAPGYGFNRPSAPPVAPTSAPASAPAQAAVPAGPPAQMPPPGPGPGPSAQAAPPSTPPSAAPAPTAPSGGAAPGAPAGIPGLITNAADMQKALSGFDLSPPKEMLEAQKEITKAQQGLADENLAQIRAEQAARNPALSNFEKLLDERKERMSQRERDLGPLALLQAGMAIMGGASPYAAVNIGAGAQVGIGAYTKGVEKLDEARDKMDEARARIEEVRRNESRMDSKELREAILAAKQPAVDAAKMTYDVYTKQWGLKSDIAKEGVKDLFANQRTMYEQVHADVRANQMPGEIRAAMLLGTGKTDAERLSSGLPVLMELKDHMTDSKLAELYNKHISDAKRDVTEPLTPEAFAKVIKGVVGAYKPKVGDVPDTNMRAR